MICHVLYLKAFDFAFIVIKNILDSTKHCLYLYIINVPTLPKPRPAINDKQLKVIKTRTYNRLINQRIPRENKFLAFCAFKENGESACTLKYDSATVLK